MAPVLSLIVPANNEAAHIAECLRAVLASAPLADDGAVQILVIANGCTDDTAGLARQWQDAARRRGWTLDVIELEQGSKLAALETGDGAAQSNVFAYLDADVIVSPELLAQTQAVLDRPEPRYASGSVRLSQARTWTARAYAQFYACVPFLRQAVPGCGYFAVNAAGRARWQSWPNIISDDTFARLSFAPNERVGVPASYDWPLVEGFGNLVRVRRRQNAGVAQIAERFPMLLANDNKPGFGAAHLLRSILAHPVGLPSMLPSRWPSKRCRPAMQAGGGVDEVHRIALSGQRLARPRHAQLFSDRRGVRRKPVDPAGL